MTHLHLICITAIFTLVGCNKVTFFGYNSVRHEANARTEISTDPISQPNEVASIPGRSPEVDANEIDDDGSVAESQPAPGNPQVPGNTLGQSDDTVPANESPTNTATEKSVEIEIVGGQTDVEPSFNVDHWNLGSGTIFLRVKNLTSDEDVQSVLGLILSKDFSIISVNLGAHKTSDEASPGLFQRDIALKFSYKWVPQSTDYAGQTLRFLLARTGSSPNLRYIDTSMVVALRPIGPTQGQLAMFNGTEGHPEAMPR